MKTGRIQIYTNPETVDKISRKAQATGLSVSSYCELLLRKSMSIPEVQKFFDLEF
jgi:hypothetical protein